MNKSKQIGGLLGPAIIAITLSEFPLFQPRLYDLQIPPLVYLSGVIFFVTGLAVVRSHNYWICNWTVLVTLSGWVFLFLGLLRMFTASFYQQTYSTLDYHSLIVIEILLFVVGLIVTIKSYSRN